MCGRFAAPASTEDLVATFGIDEVVDPARQTWNAAPTTPVSAVVDSVVSEGVLRRLVAPRWGLVPSWAKDAGGAARLINARVETVASKPSFRRAFAARRCLIPASGYYEWTPRPTPTGRPGKQPFFIHPADGGLLAMAGLYEFWRSPAGEWLVTTAILTSDAQESIASIHDRMPIGIPATAWDSWLDPRLTDPVEVQALLAQNQPPLLTAHPVSSRVGNVANDGPDLVAGL